MKRSVKKKLSIKKPCQLSDTVRMQRVFGRTQRYHVRVAYTGGVFYWICGFCGHINATRQVVRVTVTVQCTSCEAVFIPTLNMVHVSRGQKGRPADFIIPDGSESGCEFLMERFPEGDLSRWRSGGCVHEMSELPDWAAERLLRHFGVKEWRKGNNKGRNGETQ